MRGPGIIARHLLLLLAALALAGCGSTGPQLIERDQINYSSALLVGEKRQLLLNILRMREGDIPSFIHVKQVVAGYERRYLGSVGSAISQDFVIVDNFLIRGEAAVADRPTYTLAPLQGAGYAKFLLRPLPAQELMALIATDVNLATAFRLVVARINNVPNEQLIETASGQPGTFNRIVRLLQNLRNDGLLQVEFEESNGREQIFLSLPPKSRDDRARRLIELLKLDPSKDRFEVTLRVSPRHRGEIAIWTRSFMQILSSIATSAFEERAVDAESDTLPSVFRWGAAVTFRVQSSGEPLPPDDAFVRVNHEGRWYWINDNDQPTKRAFSMLLLLSKILESGGGGGGAVLTIPAN